MGILPMIRHGQDARATSVMLIMTLHSVGIIAMERRSIGIVPMIRHGRDARATLQ
jgi:hypothetical protein